MNQINEKEMKRANLGNTGALGPWREETKRSHHRRNVKVGVEEEVQSSGLGNIGG